MTRVLHIVLHKEKESTYNSLERESVAQANKYGHKVQKPGHPNLVTKTYFYIGLYMHHYEMNEKKKRTFLSLSPWHGNSISSPWQRKCQIKSPCSSSSSSSSHQEHDFPGEGESPLMK